MEWGHSKRVQVCTEGEGYLTLCVRTHLHYLFSCSCLTVSCFICRNLNLSSFRKGVFDRNGYFSPMRSISVVMNLRSTLYFKVVTYFGKIFCSVARRFIWSIILHRYRAFFILLLLSLLLLLNVITVVVSLTKTRTFCKNSNNHCSSSPKVALLYICMAKLRKRPWKVK